MERGLKEERSVVVSRYDSYTKDELILEMDRMIEMLDEPLRESARFEVDMDDYRGEYPKMFITWKRPETDKELNERAARTEQHIQMRTNHERAEYERLQKIYGDKQ